MAQFYTLEEAARVLGMSDAELMAKAQSREVRAFLDGGTWRFRAPDIDELARRRGLGSDPDLVVPDLGHASTGSGSGSGFNLADFQLGLADSNVTPAPAGAAPASDAEQDVLLDDMSLPADLMSNSTIIGMEPAGKRPGDSDVNLIPDRSSGQGAGTPASTPFSSNIGLVPITSSSSGLPPVPAPVKAPTRPSTGPVASAPSDSDVTLFHDEDDVLPPVPGRDPATERAAMSPGSSRELKAQGASRPPAPADDDDDESDFELSPSDVIGALQPDGGSDFELMALESSDEFDTSPPAPRRSPGDSDVTGLGLSASGINLARPSDSGINLQAPGTFNRERTGPSELAPRPVDDRARKDALSGTALPSRAEKDLFEDTDFEIDALDGDSSAEGQTVQIDSGSDFDLNEGESASEVFAVDEEDVDLNAATAMAPSPKRASGAGPGSGSGSGSGSAAEAADWDDDSSVEAAALRPRVGEGREDAMVDEEGPAPAAAPLRLQTAGVGADWGGLTVALCGMAAVTMILLAAVTMDLALNFRGDRDGGLSFGLVKQIAGLLGMT